MFKKAKPLIDEEENDGEESGDKKEKHPSIMIMIGMTKKHESDQAERAKKVSQMLKGNKNEKGKK